MATSTFESTVSSARPVTTDVAKQEQWAQVELGESLGGRKAGGSAAQKAREYRREDPFTLLR